MVQGADEVKILFVSGTEGDTRRYRCFHQQEQLAMRSLATGFCESDDPRLLVDVLEYDLFVLHRVPCTPLISAVIDVAQLRGRPVVFEADDLVFAPELYDSIGYVDTLSPADARRFRRDLRLQAETFQRSDCVLTTTEFLAQQARDRGKPAYVNRNAPSEEMIAISKEALSDRCQRLTEASRENGPLVLAYFSGTGSHNRDFQVITEPLQWVLETYPEAWLHVSGHLELDASFGRFRDRIRRAPYVDWRELPHLIAGVDINLAPLEADNPFCQAKSENKFVEAALVGVPTIASRVGAFEFAISHGENGLLASSPEDWRAALATLLDCPGSRREIGEAARRTVQSSYTPGARASGLVETVRTILGRYGQSGSSPEYILREWAARMKDYAEGMQEEASRWETRAESLRRTLQGYENQLIDTVKRKERLIKQKQEAIDRCRQAVQAKEEVIAHRDQTIEEIMNGRVMRLMTAWEHWIRSMKGETGHGPS